MGEEEGRHGRAVSRVRWPWVEGEKTVANYLDSFVTRKQSQLTTEQWMKLLHHITVEVLALKEAGRDMLEVCNARRGTNAMHTIKATILVDGGVPSLEYKSEADRDAISSEIEIMDSESEPISEKSLLDELRHATNAAVEHDKSPRWMAAFDLEDSKMKLAVSNCNSIQTAAKD